MNEPVVIADSDSDGETEVAVPAQSEGNVARGDKPLPANKFCLIFGHAKSIDTECKVSICLCIAQP